MGIKHIKFEEIDSTQSWLKENVSNHLGEDVLVSTRHQTSGVGRLGNNWSQFGSSIAFTFSLKPTDPITMTPLEIGVHIVNFFNELNIDLLLKWPNDILIKEDDCLKKVGGILCHYHDKETLLVGIGINLDQKSLPNESGFKFSPGALSTSLVEKNNFYHDIPLSIYEYILTRRLNSVSTKDEWSKHSCHLNKNIKIVDGSKETQGLFSGLGENGEALLTHEGRTHKVISGSLWILD